MLEECGWGAQAAERLLSMVVLRCCNVIWREKRGRWERLLMLLLLHLEGHAWGCRCIGLLLLLAKLNKILRHGLGDELRLLGPILLLRLVV